MPSPSVLANELADAVAADGNLLAALHHALSGSAGSAISTCALYPLSLAVGRLQHQRQQRRLSSRRRNTAAGLVSPRDDEEGSTTPTGDHPPRRGPAEQEYTGVVQAFLGIWRSGGGPRALYTGLAQDAIKSALDSFLFFLFYEWIRSSRPSSGRRRATGRGGDLGVLEELAIGVVAGACSKFFSTPLTNLASQKGREESFRDVIAAIRREKGITGLWSGYSASLVLTLNPSLTFFLQDFLKRKAVKAERWDNPGAATTFLLAAVSKAIASAVTYPFQTALSRVQYDVSPEARRGGWEEVVRELEAKHEAERAAAAADAAREAEEGGDGAVSPKSQPSGFKSNVAPPERNSTDEYKLEAQALRAVKNLGRQSIFATVVRIARTEGIGALYEGLHLELLMSFFGHGTTMMAKDVIHRLLFRLYIIAASVYAELQSRRARTVNLQKNAPKPRATKVTTTVVEEEIVRGFVKPAPEPISAPRALELELSTPIISTPAPVLAPKMVETPKAPTVIVSPPTPTPSPPVSTTPSIPPATISPPAPPRTLPAPLSRPALPAPESVSIPSIPSSARSSTSSFDRSSLAPPPAYSPPPSISSHSRQSSYSSIPPPAYSPPTRASLSPQAPPPPAQPRTQLRALRYRLDNEDEWGPRSIPSYPSAPAAKQAPQYQTAFATTPQRRSLSKFDDFVVGVVANMIEKTQREIKH
ncbi:mitochondrial carrier domain-containing protein [Rostrohypoxylon terebratum]|nr:mitochondrial carrier domain-containing protein [Rostrohypoxylon terebratum]